jgi:uncharacterized protein YlxP (DUF503 family)
MNNMEIATITFRLHAPWVHSLMDEISSFVEENTEAEILDEFREIR